MQQNMRPITKPDLNTIFESMLAIPADVRAQHVNAYLLTGTPEQKLAAAMIKDMPQSQAPSAPVQAPTQTVIEQKAAQAEPGIASLPVAEGMFDGGSYAGGGIIAFDDGGDVPSYAGDSRYGSLVNAATVTPIGAAVSGYKNVKDIAAGDAAQQIGGVVKNAWETYGEYLKRAANIIGVPVDTLLKETQAAPEAAKPLSQTPAAAAEKALPAPTDARTPAGSAAPNLSGIGGLSWNPISDKGAMFDELKQNVKTPQALMEERASLIGIDPNRATNDARLKAMEEKTGKAEEAAPWMALAEFGLGIAGARKGQEGEAISKSGISALQGLTAAKEKVNTAREKQYEIASRQAQADRAEKVAAADYGLNSAEHTKAENRAVQLAKTKSAIDTEAKNAEGAFNAQKGNVEVALKKAEMIQKAAADAAALRVQEKLIDSKAALAGGMDRKEIGDALINLRQDPEYVAYSAEMLKKYGKNAATQSAFKNAMDAKLQELFQNYYGGGGFKVVGVR